VRRIATIAGAGVLAGALVWGALFLTRGATESDEAVGTSEPTGEPTSEPTVYPDDVVEVVVLVDGGADPADSERAVGLITDATSMWESGLAGLSGDGEPQELAVRTETLAPEGTLELRDPEVVFVVADAAEGAGGSTLELDDAAGAGCATYADAFALGSWTGLDGFASHHRLPEGTLVAPCGGERVCFAVNATFSAGGVDPMEAFGLVGDELGHCLGQARA
jgi:hypothetical protein